MFYRSIRLLACFCPLMLGVSACDEPSIADDAGGGATRFRTCPEVCGPGETGNTSYAGQWPLANFNTTLGGSATNWLGDDDINTVLTGATITHNGATRTATSVWVTADGELRLRYSLCAPGILCTMVTLTGAQLVGAKLHFSLSGDGVPQPFTPYVRVQSYTASTIHNKPAHIYTLTTNAPKLPEDAFDGDWYLCGTSPEEASRTSVFLPSVRLNSPDLAFEGMSTGAVIACKSGASGKMVMTYGYHQTDLATANRYTGALKMTTADICGDAVSWTSPGRLINIQDSMGIRSWGDTLHAREGDYDHTGMICRGEFLRGADGIRLDDLVNDCLADIPYCDETVTTAAPGTATFGIKVQGEPTP